MITPEWTVNVAVRLSPPELLHYLERACVQLIALPIVAECLPTLGIAALTLFSEGRRFVPVVPQGVVSAGIVGLLTDVSAVQIVT